MNHKDLIKQYVDTGLKLPIHQVNHLSGSLLQTYLRKRFMRVMNSHSDLEYYEYRALDDDRQKQYIKWVIKRHENLPVRLLHVSSDSVKEFFVNEIISQRDYIELDNYLEFSDDLKLRYLKYRISDGRVVDDSFLKSFGPKAMYRYMDMLIQVSPRISNQQYNDLPDDLKVKYLNIRIDNGGVIGEQQYHDMSHDMKLRYITAVKNRDLSEIQLANTPDDLALIFLKQRLAQGWDFDEDEQQRYNRLTNEQ
jgi:hypothetical protein